MTFNDLDLAIGSLVLSSDPRLELSMKKIHAWTEFVAHPLCGALIRRGLNPTELAYNSSQLDDRLVNCQRL